MKKYLLLITASFFFFTACKKSDSSITNALVNKVTEAELIVNKHDSTIQAMLNNKLYDSIPNLTEKAVSELAKNLSDLYRIEMPVTANTYKNAAALYIESLIQIVKTQNSYSNYNDSIADAEIEILDNMNIEAVKNAKAQHLKYKEYQNAYSKATN